eukprot:c3320_g1_i1 orf=102-791(+)
MALLSSSVGGEVGLRLLLSPVGSNVIVRTACVTVGLGFPIYSTFKAIERRNPLDQDQWLVYWAVYGCFSIAEIFSDKFVSWFPFYYHAKLAFLLWLQLPLSNGSRQLFVNYLRPLLLKHQQRLDRIVDGTRNDISNFFLTHQKEIQFAKGLCQKVAITAYQAAVDVLQSSRMPEGNSSGSTVESAPLAQIPGASGEHSQTSRQPDEDPGWIDVAGGDGILEGKNTRNKS